MLARSVLEAERGRPRPRARRARPAQAKSRLPSPLLRLWQAVRRRHFLPSAATLLPELFRTETSPGFLVRIARDGGMTIERFGRIAGAETGQSRRTRAAPVDAAVIDWVLTVCRDALGRRSPVDEGATIAAGGGSYRYRCAIVPLSENGADIDCLAGLLSGAAVSRR